ncbi:MAG: hypothetical protein FWE03_01350 [Firmicutes bacterium]|nr:hypothetical protein [Bacillota bacterium]
MYKEYGINEMKKYKQEDSFIFYADWYHKSENQRGERLCLKMSVDLFRLLKQDEKTWQFIISYNAESKPQGLFRPDWLHIVDDKQKKWWTNFLRMKVLVGLLKNYMAIRIY